MEQRQSSGAAGDVNSPGWIQWQRTVLALLREDASGALRSIEFEDVDWDTWHGFYAEGRSPQAAIDRALARDF